MVDFSKCTDAEIRRLQELLYALRTPCDSWVLPSSKWKQNGFLDEFSSRLFAHHIFLHHPLMQDSFDSAFISSAELSGYSVTPASPGQRFWDVNINGESLSLKTTKAKGLKKDSLHISKLTEAAWIQDCRTASARKEYTLALFSAYFKEVDSIYQFRYFSKKNIYELVEIPVELLKPILDIPKKYFATDGPSISIPVGSDEPDLTLKLDRSDAKITLANIKKDRCVVHARWDFSRA